MDTLKFTFSVKAHAEDPKSNVIALISITTQENKSYIMPDQYQPMEHHKELAVTTAFKQIQNTLKKRGQTRRMCIKLPKDILQLYIDEEGNMIFKNYVLEEISIGTPTSREEGATSLNLSEEMLTRILEKFAHHQQGNEDPGKRNLKILSEKFVLKKFSGKSCNVSEWMNTFERECTRLGIEKDIDKIEIFRLFLEDACMDWYNAMLINLTLESEWLQWKQRFCEIYADKGWISVTHAISYKYVSGSLLDYAVRKQNLLTQTDKSMTVTTLINLIAVGLPNFVRNRINKEKLKTVENLLNEIRGLEYLVKNAERKTITNQEKKPKDKPNRPQTMYDL